MGAAVDEFERFHPFLRRSVFASASGVRSCDFDDDSDSSPYSIAGTVIRLCHLWCWAMSSELEDGLAAALIPDHLSHPHGCGWGEKLRMGLQALGDDA